MTPRAIKNSTCALAALGLVALSGCGGDTRRSETEGATAAPPASHIKPVKLPHGPAVSARATDPARRAYLAKAERVCARFDPKRNEARARAAGEGSNTARAARSYDEGIKVGERQLRTIETIPPPAGDRALLVANVFRPLHVQLALRRQIASALGAGDVAELRPLQRRVDALTRSLEGFARGYGFKVCGVD